MIKKILISLVFFTYLSLFLLIWHTNKCPNRIYSRRQPIRQEPLNCEVYGFKPLATNTTADPLPIYDYFLFNNEFDWLEIRLHELYDYVTLFLIAESRHTLSGKEKPLHLKENWSKFAEYHKKIRRVEVDLDSNPKGQWDNEGRMRNEGLYRSLQNLSKTFLLFASDLDEIPKASFVRSLVECQLPNQFNALIIECDFYYYSFEFRHKGDKWDGVSVTLWNLNTTNDRSSLPSARMLRDERSTFRHVRSGCYHCTWCFDQIKMVHSKMASYSHTEHNTEEYRARTHILDRFRHGKDLFNRPQEVYKYLANNTEIPALLKVQPERFAYLTKRARLANAGFIDV